MSPRGWAGAVAALAAILGGCAASSSATAGGTGAGATGGCQTSACVPPLGTQVNWAVEIDPLNSSPAAFTELPSVSMGASSVSMGASSVSLQADSSETVEATFTGAAGNPVPTIANVVLTVPSLIVGRPDLVFEVPAAFDASSGSIGGSLVLPKAAIGRASATLQLIPLSPADQQSPPASFSVTTAALLSEMLPTNIVQMSGTVVSAINAPPSATFVARAFLSGTQISNAPLTASDGSFQLLLAPEPGGSLVTVELTPLNQGGADPWYTSSPLDPTMNRTLASIMLPPYSSPNAFTVTVHSMSDAPDPVGGALVRAQAILDSSATGSIDFQAAGTTSLPTANGGGGSVTLSLLPGTAKTALPYDLTVVPPSSSAYATRCIQAVGVTVGGTANAPSNLTSIGLLPRPILTGTVRDAAGLPVPNVAITATAGPGPTGGCTNTPAVSSSIVADLNGNFMLPLDPGTFQLDYDPPAGAPVPRLTETSVVVPADAIQLTHNVSLPEAALVEGTVLGPDGSVLPSATVRIFQTQPALLLLAQTVSDASGNFRAVVNANAPSD
jgi:hypothetical protein